MSFRIFNCLAYVAAEAARPVAYRKARRLKLGFGFDHPGTWRAQMGAIARHDVRSRLAEIDLPTLIVGAGCDLLVPERHSKQLHAAIPHARYLSFPHAGHGVLAEEADPISEAMAGLFAQADPPAQASRG